MHGSHIHEKAVAFIVVRLSSTRLPAKHFRTIGDRPMLQWVMDRLRNSTEVDEIVLATVDEPENRPLEDFAKSNGIACYWYTGAVDHVTTRLRRAASAFDADICVLVSGDCPLIHAPAIDTIIRCLRRDPDADSVRLDSDSSGHPPALQGIVANRRRAWQLADDLADRPEHKEHQFPVIYLRPEYFHPIDVRLDETLCMAPHRLSVDTLADFEFMNAMYAHLEKHNLPFDLPHVVELLKHKPELKEINSHVHQCRLVENKKRVLFVVDAGGEFGYGHLTRCIELARQLTERLAWSTHFLVDDRQAMETVRQMGFTVHWGVFARPVNQEGNQPPVALASIGCQYDLLVIDIFDQRGPDVGWRSCFEKNIGCVVMENSQPWAREADMIVQPNLLDKRPDWLPSKAKSSDPKLGSIIKPKIIGGADYIILRNDIKRLASQKVEKSGDVLVYLHDGRRCESIRVILKGLTFSFRIVDSFQKTFSDDLAHARIFISGFGVSFNEAVALGTIPICWPDSDAHREDAIRFFRNLQMKPLIVDSPADIQLMVSSALARPPRIPTTIKDGTANIVSEIAKLPI